MKSGYFSKSYALGGIPNKTQVGDMGIDGRIYPVGSEPKHSGKAAGELDFMDEWYPIQVKQLDRVKRPDIDKFEAAMMRSKRKKGFFVGFDFSRDAMTEINGFFRREHAVIVPLTVEEILDESIAQKLVLRKLRLPTLVRFYPGYRGYGDSMSVTCVRQDDAKSA